MTKQELDKLIKAHKENPSAGRKALAKMTGLSERACRNFLEKNCDTTATITAAPGIKKKTLSDFRHTYDKSTIVPAAIRKALKELGATGWEYEVAFAKSAGVSLADIGTFRDMFADNIVSIKRDNKRVWVGSVSAAKQMREMV